MTLIRDGRSIRRSLAIITGLLLLNLFGACTPRSDAPIQNVVKDTVYDDLDTIGILELKIEDMTFSLDSYLPVLVVNRVVPVYFYDSNLEPMEWLAWRYWRTQDMANAFEAVCLLRIKPGSYGITNLMLEKQRTSNFDQSHIVSVPVGKRWQVPASRLAYLGQIEVNFSKRRIGKNGKVTYKHDLIVTHEATDYLHALNRFKLAYPKIYKHYGSKLQILEPKTGGKLPAK